MEDIERYRALEASVDSVQKWMVKAPHSGWKKQRSWRSWP
jgi:hypothetical protein